MSTDQIEKMELRAQILDAFGIVYGNQHEGAAAPHMTDNTVLLESGLDSLGFAILVTNLEEELGYDPFSLSAEPYYPQTLGEFVDFYDRHRPR